MNAMHRILGGRNVLVADREPLVRRRVSGLFEDMGLETYEAGRGEEALEVIAAVEISVLVLDSGLPDFGGLETIRVIRTFQEVPPYLLMADEMTRELRFSALHDQATSILPKPVDLSVLGDIVRTMLGGGWG